MFTWASYWADFGEWWVGNLDSVHEQWRKFSLIWAVMLALLTLVSGLVSSMFLSADVMPIVWPCLTALAFFFLFALVLRARTRSFLFGEIGFVYMGLALTYTLSPALKFILLNADIPTTFDQLGFSVLKPTATEMGEHFWRHVLFMAAVGAGYLLFRGRKPLSFIPQTKTQPGYGVLIPLLLVMIGLCFAVIVLLSAPVNSYIDHYTRYSHLSGFLLFIVQASILIKTGIYFVLLPLLFLQYQRYRILIYTLVPFLCALEIYYSLGARIVALVIWIACMALYHFRVLTLSVKKVLLLLVVATLGFWLIGQVRLLNPLSEGFGTVLAKVKSDLFPNSFPAPKALGIEEHQHDLLACWLGRGVYFRDAIYGYWLKIASDGRRVAVGDIDGDGVDDPVFVGGERNEVFAHFSSVKRWVRMGEDACDIATGDINNDGRVDLLAVFLNRGVYYRCSASGIWIRVASAAHRIAIGDIDGDGQSDLIGSWPDQKGVFVRYSSTKEWERIASAAADIAICDIDGDGRRDVVASWPDKGLFYRNAVDGAWVRLASPASTVATGHFDGDAIMDIVAVWPKLNKTYARHSTVKTWGQIAPAADDVAGGRIRNASWLSMQVDGETVIEQKATDSVVGQHYDLSFRDPFKATESVLDMQSLNAKSDAPSSRGSTVKSDRTGVNDTVRNLKSRRSKSKPRLSFGEEDSVFCSGFHLYLERKEGRLPPRHWLLHVDDVLAPIPLVDHITYNPVYWYAKRYFPDRAVPPTTFGVIAQSAILGGEWDLLLRSLLNGMLFALLTVWYVNRQEKWWALVVYVFAFSTSIMVLKYSVFHQLAPLLRSIIPAILLVFLVMKVQKRESKSGE